MDEILEIGKNVGIFLAEVIIAISVCSKYIKAKLKKPDISNLVAKQNLIDINVEEKLDYAKEILNADRIHVYEFHNGEHYSDYRSSCKFSCSYEVVRAGRESVRNQCTNLPISVMPKFINKITTEGKFYCKDISEIRDVMPSTHEFKKEIEIKSFYDVAIRNVKGSIIGFIAIHWCNGTTPNINIDEINKLVWYVEEKIQEAVRLNKS